MPTSTLLRVAVSTLLAIAAFCAEPVHPQSRDSINARHAENPMDISKSRTLALMESFSASRTLNTQQSGEQVYHAICQGCHMSQGQGSRPGAGSYPRLAKNPRLAASGYPAFVVTNGLRGMPPFGARLNDQQIAEVTNYVRTNFGNNYPDGIKSEEVKTLRAQTPAR